MSPKRRVFGPVRDLADVFRFFGRKPVSINWLTNALQSFLMFNIVIVSGHNVMASRSRSLESQDIMGGTCSSSLNRRMRARLSGGVGRVPGNWDRYPISGW
jgi:hypothetical protein